MSENKGATPKWRQEIGTIGTGRCPRCKGNGRIEMLEHCPECGGPFEHHNVVVNGRVVPFLEATPTRTGVHLSLDHRLGLDLTDVEALEVVPFIADCIAVALGYSCFPCSELPEPPRLSPWPRLTSLADYRPEGEP